MQQGVDGKVDGNLKEGRVAERQGMIKGQGRGRTTECLGSHFPLSLVRQERSFALFFFSLTILSPESVSIFQSYSYFRTL